MLTSSPGAVLECGDHGLYVIYNIYIYSPTWSCLGALISEEHQMYVCPPYFMDLHHHHIPPGSSTLPLSLKPKVPFFQIWTFWLPRSSTHLNSRSQGLLDFCSVRPRRVAHATPDNGKRFPSDTEFRHARVPHSLHSSHSTPPIHSSHSSPSPLSSFTPIIVSLSLSLSPSLP